MRKNLDLKAKTLKSITYRYGLAVFLIAAFSVLSFIFNRVERGRSEADFRVINISGRQRMLSQNIALLVHQGRSEELKRSLSEFKAGLDILERSRFVTSDYPSIYDSYMAPGGLHELSLNYIDLASRAMQTRGLLTQLFDNSQHILYKYDQVTFLKQQLSEDEFHDRLMIELFILIGTLALLVMEVLGIFIPMVRSVKRAFEKLDQFEENSFEQSRLVLLGEATSSVGHEIANPLSVIINSAEGVNRINSQTYSDPRIKGLSELVLKHSNRINKLLQSLKTQSRRGSEDPMAAAPVSVIIDDAVELFSAKMQIYNINFSREDNCPVEVTCRQAEISQVVANLLSNAIDSVCEMTTGRIREIKILTKVDTAGLMIRISDSGPGVPAGLENEVFESFITTKKTGKGTGLGLSISKKIMLEHDGDISLNTNVCRSCFEIHFPPSKIVFAQTHA